MEESGVDNFNNITQEIIDKSLFTRRQIEIILNRRGLIRKEFGVSRGAYYRQLGQVRTKLGRFYYTVVLLCGTGILSPEDLAVLDRMSEQLSVITEGGIPASGEADIMGVIDTLIRRVGEV